MCVTRAELPSLKLAILLGILMGCNVAPWKTADAELIAHWRFEEGPADTVAEGALSILDSSGNDHHGIAFGGPIYRSVSHPASALALELDGVDARVHVEDNPLFELTKSLTLEALVRVDKFGADQAILYRGDNRGGLDPYQMAVIDDGRLGFAIDNAANQRVVLRSPESLPLGELVHVAGTLDDETGDMKLYVNGALVNELNTSIRPFGPLDPTEAPAVAVGSLNHGSWYFDGLIDEVRIYDEARTIPEPSSLVIWAIAAVGLAMFCRRKSWKTRNILS